MLYLVRPSRSVMWAEFLPKFLPYGILWKRDGNEVMSLNRYGQPNITDN